MIRGIVIGQESVDTALVQLADLQDMAQLVTGAGVGVVRPTAVGAKLNAADVVGQPLYARLETGEFVPVGECASINVDLRQDRFEITSFQDSERQYTQHPRCVKVRGEFIGRLGW